MSDSSTAVDVAVIGAGPAGLHAADLLGRAGYSVAVLEGRDRVGGRLLSILTDAGVLDLGATWFWSNEPRVNDIVHRHKLDSFAQYLDGDAMFQDDQGGVQRMQGNQIDAPSGRLSQGAQSIAHALAGRLDGSVVQLRTTVASVVDAADGTDRLAVIATDGRVWNARQVIIATPPATALERIDFDGALSNRVRSLAGATPVWMGNIVKVVAEYERAFWRDDGLAGAAFSYSGPMRELHDMSGPDGSPAAIFGFAQPGIGRPAPSAASVLDQLTALFGPPASRPTTLHIQDWRAEPLTSPTNVDELSNYQTYGHPLFAEPALGARAHWASTETATTAPGHIEGALQAGSRAAEAAIVAMSEG